MHMLKSTHGILGSVGGHELERPCFEPSKHSCVGAHVEGFITGSKPVSLQTINETFHACCGTMQKQGRRCLRPGGAESFQRHTSSPKTLLSSRSAKGKPWKSRASRPRGLPTSKPGSTILQTWLYLQPPAACLASLAHVCQCDQACIDALLGPIGHFAAWLTFSPKGLEVLPKHQQSTCSTITETETAS